MCTNVENAGVLYQKACLAAEAGQMDLAESFYLQSLGCYEQFGGTHLLNAANALNALACLRMSQGNHEGALEAAKQALLVMEDSKVHSADAELVRGTAWELIELAIAGYWH